MWSVTRIHAVCLLLLLSCDFMWLKINKGCCCDSTFPLPPYIKCLSDICERRQAGCCCFIGRIVNDAVPTSVEFLTNSHSDHEHVQPTVQLSEDGICSRLKGKVGKGPDTEDMVTVAIRINTDTLQNIKVWTLLSVVWLHYLVERLHCFHAVDWVVGRAIQPVKNFCFKTVTDIVIHDFICQMTVQKLKPANSKKTKG